MYQTAQFLSLYDGLWWKWLFTLKNVSKNDWKLIIEGVGIKMSWAEKNRKINNRVGTIIRDSRVVIRNKFTYLTESICKINQTYNLNSVYLNVLVIFIICTPFRVAPRIEKTEVWKKVDILQAVLVCKLHHEKRFFYYGGKKKHIFFIFIMQLSSTVLSYLNAHSTLNFSGTFFYV